ncbi:imelysin family protein [Mesorhizobium atlanticum]
MSKRLAAALALPLLLATALPASAAVKASDVIGRAIDGFVRPAYAGLDEHAAGLTRRCTSYARRRRNESRSGAFGVSGTVEAWSVAEIIAFGPIKENNRLERMLYWPDRKTHRPEASAGHARIEGSVSHRSGAAGAKSVAMQGLGALRYVLFGDGAETLAGKDDPYRCAYGEAVAGNIKTMAGEVVDAWQSPTASLRSGPIPDRRTRSTATATKR